MTASASCLRKKEHGFDGILDVLKGGAPLTEAMEPYTGVGHDYELQYLLDC